MKKMPKGIMILCQHTKNYNHIQLLSYGLGWMNRRAVRQKDGQDG